MFCPRPPCSRVSLEAEWGKGHALCFSEKLSPHPTPPALVLHSAPLQQDALWYQEIGCLILALIIHK